jgi:hypothetical protein
MRFSVESIDVVGTLALIGASRNHFHLDYVFFLDTSIVDGQQYNFQSTALSTLVPACSKRSMKLLLPESTERAITRHIPSVQAATPMISLCCLDHSCTVV